MKNFSLIFFIFFYFTCFNLAAGLEDYFQKVKNKENNHGMRNIDFIYMINLDERPEKFAQSLKELSPFGINPYRFSAVNGWKLDVHTINDIGVKFDPTTMRGKSMATVYRSYNDEIYESNEIMQEEGITYFAHGLSRGAIGCVLSHLSVLQDAYDSGYETIWVMEDDIQVVSDPNEISNLITKLDLLLPMWDIFFTDPDVKNHEGLAIPCYSICQKPNFNIRPLEYYLFKMNISEDFKLIRARFGSHSMIVRRSGMKKILDFIKEYKIFLAYDVDYCYPPDITLISSTRDIVSNRPGAATDNAAPNYKNQSDLKKT